MISNHIFIVLSNTIHINFHDHYISALPFMVLCAAESNFSITPVKSYAGCDQ